MGNKRVFWQLSSRQSPQSHSSDQNDDSSQGHNPRVKAALLETVENQLRDNNPPETRKTLDRLLGLGIDPKAARKLIAAVMIAEMNAMLKEDRVFNEARYVADLQQLPELPWDR